MVRASNPRLMARVLEAVKHLGEGRGSSAKQVLEVLLRQANDDPPTRNLAMQVHRALKNAVTAGLLQLRSGRYKMLIPLKTGVKNRSGSGKAVKPRTGNPAAAGRKNEDIEKATDSPSPQAHDARPKKRCSHCKKHKRRSSKRHRKRSSRRRRRPTRQARERESRKRRRQGDEEVSTRPDRHRKSDSPGARTVPGNGHKSEKLGKKRRKLDQENNGQDYETHDSVIGNRSPSSSGSECEKDEPQKTTREKPSSAGRKRDSSSHRRGPNVRRRSSMRGTRSPRRTGGSHQGGSNHRCTMDADACEDGGMDRCDDETQGENVHDNSDETIDVEKDAAAAAAADRNLRNSGSDDSL
ncbi:splicing regulatory glutamine/lysine-rich protein 1-like [Neodiprion fabricii]|uniref:splicing regulatory glutamine/lysine-rich protein 1-like n=1 Tax=Neodiprion fabricii TaxID=2872261 RepID=UPI001ED94F10|nr:splicing regulatory glutamine/lysine-rich protein 1-like [Neodiprion fabricii]